MMETQLLQLFPRLEIVSIDDLLVYESFDPVRIAHLTKKISDDNTFLQPIIIGEEPENKKRIVLDGVNRIEVLKRLGIRNVVAHVVNYFEKSEVELFSNHHYFFNKHEELFQMIYGIVGGEMSQLSLEEAIEQVKNQTLVGYIRHNGNVYSLGSHRNIDSTVHLLNTLVSSYLGQTDFCRRSEVDLSLSNVPMELVFRRFTPDEIVQLSLSGGRLNSGITRHVVSVYCLGLYVPLSLLESDTPLEEKNKQLQTMLFNLVVDRGYRFYPRPIFKFDEKE